MTTSRPPDPVELALGSTIRNWTVLAAVSGGPDSMAMFHGLCELAKERGNVRVVAAHFNHRLRPDSARDIETVACLAQRYGARVITGDADVAAYARTERRSIEDAARELRYAFLERAADEAGADVIATAHTRDDQHETVVMRMMRGAGDRGLRGIPERRGRIVRPLLLVSRARTVQHCLDHGVPFVDDPSNTDRRFLRNHVRMDVLPALRATYADLDAVLDQISESARVSFETSLRATEGRIGALRRERGAWSLPFSAFDGLDQVTRVHLLMRVFLEIGTGDNVAKGHYAAMLRMIDDGPTGTSVDLPEIRVGREHDALVFARRGSARRARTTGQALEVPGTLRIGEWTLAAERVSGAQARAELAKPLPAGISYLPAAGSLTVRFAQPGDRMQPFGMRGHKKLSDLFIDRKIPRRLRSRIPVVEAGGEIVWVVGVAMSERARVRGDEKAVVRLSAVRQAAFS